MLYRGSDVFRETAKPYAAASLTSYKYNLLAIYGGR